MKIELEEITPFAEEKIIRIARVSNPANQENPEYARLLRYCVRHGHWSVFEHAHMTMYIETSLAVATQILRHRSFTFQQFSQRYADPTELGFERVELRKQADKNRQSSSEIIDTFIEASLLQEWRELQEKTENLYRNMLTFGVAKECARFILPQCTTTRLYMTGNIRSWIHYLQLRTQENVQKEHREVALSIQKFFIREFPVIAEALEWTQKEGEDA